MLAERAEVKVSVCKSEQMGYLSREIYATKRTITFKMKRDALGICEMKMCFE